MNYFYDILVNLADEYYEFYEWEKKDEIIPIKKTPMIRVKEKILLDFLTHEITIQDPLFTELVGKTNTKNQKEKLTGCLITDTTNSIFIELNEKGKVMYRSKLLIEDENSVNEIANTLKEEEIPYEVGEKLVIKKELRRTKYEKRLIESAIKELKEKENIDKYQYLYYELFHEINENYREGLQKMEEILPKIKPSIIHHLAHIIRLANKENSL